MHSPVGVSAHAGGATSHITIAAATNGLIGMRADTPGTADQGSLTWESVIAWRIDSQRTAERTRSKLQDLLLMGFDDKCIGKIMANQIRLAVRSCHRRGYVRRTVPGKMAIMTHHPRTLETCWLSPSGPLPSRQSSFRLNPFVMPACHDTAHHQGNIECDCDVGCVRKFPEKWHLLLHSLIIPVAYWEATGSHALHTWEVPRKCHFLPGNRFDVFGNES